MKSCDRMPTRWDDRGEGRSRWHVLFCPTCRAARRADRELTRQARLLRREPVPSDLEARIRRRVGLPEPTSAPAIRGARGLATFPGSRIVGLACVALVLTLLARPLDIGIRWRRPASPDERKRSVVERNGVGLTPRPPSLKGRGSLPHGNSDDFPPLPFREGGPGGLGIPNPGRGGRTVHRPDVPLARNGEAPDHRASRAPREGQTPIPMRPWDDLAYLNGPSMPTSPSDRGTHAERQAASKPRSPTFGDDFVSVAPPRIAAAGSTADRAAAESLAACQREVAIVDPRLAHKVTLAFKATALSDLCDQVRSETSIHLVAGRSVADEKVTLFCKQMPLRDVMRQLSRPFGYTWLRSGKEREYRYELVQDLRSQLMEEELRNRDRNAALLALDQEMQRYRKYLNLSPDEARAAATGASPEEKKLLERYGGSGWGLIQIYFRLSRDDIAALRAGKRVFFSAEPKPDQQLLPSDLAHGVLQSQRDRRIFQKEGHFRLGKWNGPEGVPPAAVPEARAQLMLTIEQSELGQFSYGGGPGTFISKSSQIPGGFDIFGSADGLAIGQSPAVLNPRNAAANAKLAEDPALRRRVTVRPEPSIRPTGSDVKLAPHLAKFGVDDPRPKVTTADVLEALHRATGLPIVADYYTRLYPASELSVQDMPLFDALNRLSDGMRLRWSKDGEWLQFRSTSFFHDRLKEVPNRLLARWAASRKQHGALTLEDLIEIDRLSDAQLDASGMAEGARLCFGLAEWPLLRVTYLRAHLRFLGEFTPGQRELAQRPEGLLFSQMTLPQQQGYLARALLPDANARIEDLSHATLHIDYTLPGWFRWSPPGRVFRPSPVRERTREAALQAARRIDPNVPEEQIQPTRLDVTVLYTPNPNRRGAVRVGRTTDDGWLAPP